MSLFSFYNKVFLNFIAAKLLNSTKPSSSSSYFFNVMLFLYDFSLYCFIISFLVISLELKFSFLLMDCNVLLIL